MGENGIDRRDLGFKALAGLLGGALGWLPVEVVSHGHSLTEAQSDWSIIGNFVSMALLSGLIGGMINASQLQTVELTGPVRRRFLIGLAVCGLLSLPATYYSNLAFSYILMAGGWGFNHAGSMVYLILARVLSWSLMGLMLGAGVGLATSSIANLLKGAAGGWIGGFVGGVAFDAISAQSGGLLSRLIGLSAIGLAIGLFIGLVQELTKQAWLTTAQGRLRGREFRLDRSVATIGRAEENEIGLFGDPEVIPRHARIERKDGEFLLTDLSHSQGTFVNGNRVETVALRDGDRIRIGGYEMVFNLRKASAQSLKGAPTISAAAASAPEPAAGGPTVTDPQGRRIALRLGTPTSLGRATDNDIVIGDGSVSRHHAHIVPQNGAFVLRDLDSHNGTFIDGQRVSEATLVNGSVIRLGEAELRFHA